MSKQIKTLALVCGLLLGLTMGAKADGAFVKVPVQDKGINQANPSYAGAISSCTANSSSAWLAFTGAGVLYEIRQDSAATTAYAEVRDSATANTSSALLTPRLYGATAQQTVATFSPPIRFTNALSVDNSASTTMTTCVLFMSTK
jgi:hypothetical protein